MLLVFVVFIAVLGSVGQRASPASAAQGAYIATDVLNVRSEPGTWADVLNQLVWGEWVEVLDGPTWDNWYYIGYWGGVGWVLGDYLSFDGLDAVGGAAWGSGGDDGLWISAWVDTDALNVRGGASSNAEVLDTVWYGEGINIVGYNQNGFVPISHWSGVAWVWEGYLSYGGPPGPVRWVDVDRSSEMVTLYEGDVVVASFWGALGWDTSNDGFYATANGTFYVYAKGRELSPAWGGVWVTDWVGFDPVRSNGFHSYSRDRRGNVLPNGANPTGGCVALDPWASSYLFDFVSIGTRVEVHW
jgi:hypothetical protein